jgi:hypothetical protein
MPDARQQAHHTCICPWWLMYFADYRLRRMIQPTAAAGFRLRSQPQVRFSRAAVLH